MNTPTQHLSTTPLHAWPPEALMREARRTALFWRNNPAFHESHGSLQSGGLYANQEERSAEIIVRVLSRLKKEPPKPHLDQITFFHQVARYCLDGIIQANSAPASVAYADGGVEDDADDSGGIASPFFDVADDNESDHADAIRDLFKKIGVGEKDFALFDTTAEEWKETTGSSERHWRNKKTQRKKEILSTIKAKNLGDEVARLMPRLRDVLLAGV
ncbi:conserved hypothetical protein [Thiomonas arsenitoxydans]|uniref:Uncharacterized protein n=1 Tax=Thiomonas arsenitoxydans (strain DSM 22701 / CIP 110005 / 3As) TaxID=426114 RepID=D6CUI8_THIA3|nr:hypothetical protein [Thiomonas arsenitoxydans]CAZ88957.1 hypothetical protein THI_2317 [Thiomonas arsenitoxydans]CQR29538.1 conserved hypothetical protein [Thiomonas arsenitoxydans]CQR34883.1 conserved hypothetical protein [Thiomonas arsenitoxydans]CQR35942.1 conserved hypothetical protein [Thiomonas arsenitoxydans]CQR36035.1 conserved hypothetical protein [Thiomonas arsenitoxydans]